MADDSTSYQDKCQTGCAGDTDEECGGGTQYMSVYKTDLKQGCYADKPQDPMFTVKAIAPNITSREACRAYCRGDSDKYREFNHRFYKFSGITTLENGMKLCRCGDSFDSARARAERYCRPTTEKEGDGLPVPNFHPEKENGKCVGKTFIDTVDCEDHKNEFECTNQKNEFGLKMCKWKDEKDLLSFKRKAKKEEKEAAKAENKAAKEKMKADKKAAKADKKEAREKKKADKKAKNAAKGKEVAVDVTLELYQDPDRGKFQNCLIVNAWATPDAVSEMDDDAARDAVVTYVVKQLAAGSQEEIETSSDKRLLSFCEVKAQKKEPNTVYTEIYSTGTQVICSEVNAGEEKKMKCPEMSRIEHILYADFGSEGVRNASKGEVETAVEAAEKEEQYGECMVREQYTRCGQTVHVLCPTGTRMVGGGVIGFGWTKKLPQHR
jgi:hypothetical protein